MIRATTVRCPHYVCGCSPQPQHARWLLKRRYAASVWEKGRGGDGESEGGDPGEEKSKYELQFAELPNEMTPIRFDLEE